MALTPDTRLGAYAVLDLIGAGGMGEVYRARDTRLDRIVALKILPPEFAEDEDRRARFTREAKTISQLSHPHICALYDVGEAHSEDVGAGFSRPDLQYLVMEFVEGETLAARLDRGAVPIEQALRIGAEIADALAHAHRHGIVHRDLKPANVMLTNSGAKLLDFGLAKLRAGAGLWPSASSGHPEPVEGWALGSGEHVRPAATTDSLTTEGKVLGTVPYMAPEQIEGKDTDARTDLFALGCVLYELVTGRRAFAGETSAALMSAILKDDPPPLTERQPLAPPALDHVVRQCLAKAPDDRWESAHDMADELRWLRDTSGFPEVRGVRPERRRRLRAAWMITGSLALVLAGAGVMWVLRPAVPNVPSARVSLDVRPAETLNASGVYTGFLPTPGGSRTALTWTPDGEALVFVGRRNGVQQLYVRRLDDAEARPLAGTEGAQLPAVSPDGQWVAFWADRAIKKVPLGGGPVVDLAPVAGVPPFGLAWADSGDVFFAETAGAIWQIPAEGAPAAVTTAGEGEVSPALPTPLPGGRTILFTARKRKWSWGDEEIVAQTLATGARKVLLRNAVDARYVPTGHLVFLRRGVLFAVPFDVERLEIRGPEVPLLDGVAQALTGGNSYDVTGAGQFAISATGSLAWVPGPVAPQREVELVAVDRRGQIAPLPAARRAFGQWVRVSPDGRRLAVVIGTLAERGLWRYDLGRGTLTPLAGGGEATSPIWWPDGQRLAFAWLKDGRWSVMTLPADGSAAPSVLVPTSGDLRPSSFTPDGRQLAAAEQQSVVDADIVIVTVENGTSKVERPVQTPDAERWPEFSPDGRWLVYGSNVSGRNEIYVRPYPGPGVAEQVSVKGGTSPAWHPNGRELFFVTVPDADGTRRMMAVAFEAGSPPRIGRPSVLFPFDQRDLVFACIPARCYDVAPDGARFYGARATAPPPPPVVTHINLIQNWFEELKAKVPVR